MRKGRLGSFPAFIEAGWNCPLPSGKQPSHVSFHGTFNLMSARVGQHAINCPDHSAQRYLGETEIFKFFWKKW